jgi:hypothetical protein
LRSLFCCRKDIYDQVDFFRYGWYFVG